MAYFTNLYAFQMENLNGWILYLYVCVCACIWLCIIGYTYVCNAYMTCAYVLYTHTHICIYKTNDIVVIIINLSTKGSPVQNSTRPQSRMNAKTSQTILQNRKEGTFPNYFYKASIILI